MTLTLENKCDEYLVKIMFIAAKQSFIRKWEGLILPSKEQWISTVQDIFLMGKLTYRLRLQEPQLESK